jgi:transposase
MVKSIMIDAGYTAKPFADTVNELLGATVAVAKRSELHTFKVIPKRWVVERSFAWLEKCRRLWENTERKLNNPSVCSFSFLGYIHVVAGNAGFQQVIISF